MGSRLKRRPRIGVTAARRGGRLMWWFNRFSLWRAGAEAVRIRPQEPSGLDRLDGLLVGGGDDIGVQLYGLVPAPNVRVDLERDALELELVRRAHHRRMPVLGVCRGAQMINVAFGGSLHTDIHEVYVEAPRLRTVLPRKCIDVDADSRLCRLVGKPQIKVNALHHQSVDRVGDGLAVVARDQHGIVQAIEVTAADEFLFGVQWHPEFLVFDSRQHALFDALVDAAQRYALGGEPGAAVSG